MRRLAPPFQEQPPFSGVNHEYMPFRHSELGPTMRSSRYRGFRGAGIQDQTVSTIKANTALKSGLFRIRALIRAG